ncbi:MAG: DUF4406 domain-containing protein [Ruthenibacterium sp.]
MSKQIHRAYVDPTADFAIGHAMLEENRRFRKRVFICSPFAGAIDNNVAAAKRYCAFAIQNDAAPFAPHLLYPQFMDDSLPRRRDEALRCGMAFLRACHEVWVFGAKTSPGMNREIQLAQTLKKPIRHFDTNCREVQKNVQSAECSH